MKQLTSKRTAPFLLTACLGIFLTISACQEEIADFCFWQAQLSGNAISFEECSASFNERFAFFGGFSTDGTNTINIFDFELTEGVQAIDTGSVDGLNANLFMNGERYDAVSGTFEFTDIIVGSDTNSSASMNFMMQGPGGMETFTATAEGVLFNK